MCERTFRLVQISSLEIGNVYIVSPPTAVGLDFYSSPTNVFVLSISKYESDWDDTKFLYFKSYDLLRSSFTFLDIHTVVLKRLTMNDIICATGYNRWFYIRVFPKYTKLTTLTFLYKINTK